MTALGWLCIGVLLVVTGISLIFASYCATELDRVQRLHGRHVPPRKLAARPRRPGTVPVSLIGVEQTAAYAGAMHQAAEPFLPPAPQGDHPYPPYVPVWLPVERKQTEDHAPWTGSQPALTDEAVDHMRGDYLRSYLAEQGEVTPETLRDAMDGLRDLPAYGEKSVADVLEAERLADRVIT